MLSDPALRAPLARLLAARCAGTHVDHIAVALAALASRGGPLPHTEGVRYWVAEAGLHISWRSAGAAGDYPEVRDQPVEVAAALEALRQLVVRMSGGPRMEPDYYAGMALRGDVPVGQQVLAAAGVPDALRETVLALLRDGMPYRDALTAARLLVEV